MNYRHLLSLSTMIFGGALIFNILFLALNVVMNLSGSVDSSLSRHSIDNNLLERTATIYDRDGYDIPVRFSLFYPDTIVQIAGELNEETKTKESWIQENGPFNNRHWLNTWPGSLKEFLNNYYPKFDTIYAVDTLITRDIITKAVNQVGDMAWYGSKIDARSKENIFDLKQRQQEADAVVSIRPKTRHQRILLYLRTNLKILFNIFILFQLLKSILGLKAKFVVSAELYNRIKSIGLAILLYTFSQFLLDYMVAELYDLIAIESRSTAINYIDNIHIYMYSNYYFSFEYFYAGLILIIFSFLMKGALETEKNWALTI